MQSPFKPLLPTQKCDRLFSRTLLNILYLRELSTEDQKNNNNKQTLLQPGNRKCRFYVPKKNSGEGVGESTSWWS